MVTDSLSGTHLQSFEESMGVSMEVPARGCLGIFRWRHPVVPFDRCSCKLGFQVIGQGLGLEQLFDSEKHQTKTNKEHKEQ